MYSYWVWNLGDEKRYDQSTLISKQTFNARQAATVKQQGKQRYRIKDNQPAAMEVVTATAKVTLINCNTNSKTKQQQHQPMATPSNSNTN